MAHKNKEGRALITKILNVAGVSGSTRAKQRLALEALTVAQLRTIHTKAKAQAQGAISQGRSVAKQAPKKRATARKTAAKKAAPRKTAAKKSTPRKTAAKKSVAKKTSTKRATLPKTLKARAARIANAITAGKIAAKRGITSPAKAPGKTARERYDKFVALYAGQRITRRKTSSKTAAPSMKSVYDGIKAAGKKPYFLSKGYHVKGFDVGGGGRGPGTVRKIAGTKAKPFSVLAPAEKKKVISFLNTSAGQVLRAKGAPKTASLAEMERVAKQKTAAARKSTSKRGAANWW